MTRLGAFTKMGILQLDEVTHMGLGIEHGPRAQAGKWPCITALAHDGTLKVTVGLDHGTFAQRAILDHTIRANLHVVFDDNLAFQNDVDVDQHIPADRHFAPDIETRRVTQGHTLRHQAAAFAQLVVTLQFGKLTTVVGTLHFHGIGRLLGGDHQAISDCHGDHIRQVVLALGIVVRQAAHPIRQASARKRQNAGVALTNGLLRLVGVFMLDDGRYLPIRITHNTAIARRVCERDREQTELLLAGFGQQTLQGRHFDERHVAVQHQNGVRAKRWQSLRQGMPCTQLLVLHDKVEVVAFQSRLNQLCPMAYHHVDALRLKLASAVDNMTEHGVARYRVQYLGQRRAHAGALAGGKNNDIEGHDWLPILGGQLLDRKGKIEKRKRVAEATLLLNRNTNDGRSRSLASAHLLDSTQLSRSLGQTCGSSAVVEVRAFGVQRVLGSLEGFLSLSFVQVGSTLHGVGKNLHHVWLHFEEATGDVVHLLSATLLGQRDRTRLEIGDQRGVTWCDTQIAQVAVRYYHLDQTGEDFSFRADDIAMDCHSHLLAST